MLYLPVKPSYNKIDKKSYIKVRSCYYISVSNEMLYSRRFLESCELMYVMSGRIYISADGVEYTIGENEVLILPRYKVVSSVKRTGLPHEILHSRIHLLGRRDVPACRSSSSGA